MSDTIKCSIEVDVNGTLKLKIPRTITVDSFQKIEVEVPTANDVDVSLPGNLADLEFFLLSASTYGATILMGNETSTDTTLATAFIALEGPLLLFGGAIGANLTTPAFTDTLRFRNIDPGASTVSIQIIIGVNVATIVPPPPP